MPTPTRFITLEGAEGCGKSTQAQLIEHWLIANRCDLLVVREPGGTPIGEEIRTLLKHHPQTVDITDETELLLFAASRAELVRKKIRPHLNAGGWVLCDRFFDSTTVYQGMARGLDRKAVETINSFAIGDTIPGCTLYFDCPLEHALHRVETRKSPEDPQDRLDQLGKDFYAKVIQGYDFLAQCEPARIRRIDASQPVESVFTTVKEILRHVFSPELDR